MSIGSVLAKWFGSSEPLGPPTVSTKGPAPIKGVEQHQTVADRLDWLCAKHKATYSIKRLSGGVVVYLELSDMNIVSSGVQSSMAAAVDVVARKLEGVK